MSLLEDEIKPTPRNYLLGLLADAAQKANETVSRPAGYDNPPARMLMSLLGVPAIAQTLDRLSYGEPLTTGRGMTTKMRPEVTEALLSVAPGVGPAAKATGKAAKSVAPKAAQMAEQYMFEQGLAKPIIVWHGSPHKFDKFDASKIGTGEGAQAYGHGLYVAEDPKVASFYKNSVRAKDEQLIKDKDIRNLTAEDYKTLGELTSKEYASRSDKRFALTPQEQATLTKLRDFQEAETRKLWKARDEASNLYKIDLPDEQIARMLDWNDVIANQPKVASALKGSKLIGDEPLSQAYKATQGEPLKYASGMTLEKFLTDEFGQPELAAQYLRERGIPGIRYLDSGSRGQGQGTSNFVIFPGEESILKILERNGIPIESLL